MASNARNLANLLRTGETQISAAKLGSDVAPGTEDYSNVDSLGVGTTIGETAFVQGSNRMYIWNGSGWYNIALINTSPTWDSGGQPSGSYELDADSPQDATVITLAASDPEGLPISYSYVTSGSMDSMATISQDSSVFTITPKTVTEVGEGVELTGSITFRASDGVNILPQVSGFTLRFITTIENSRYTTLLVTATDTSDNNNITDSSTNNHTITVTGDAHAGTFSPYRHGGYSWDFEGGTNAVSGQVTEGTAIVAQSTGTDFNVGTNDYSIECWFKHRTPTTYTTNEHFRICEFNDIPNGGSNDRISLQHNNVGNISVKENGSVIVTTTSTPCDGEWHFIQVVRTGGTTAVYVDGTQEASASSSTNIGAISRIVVGAWYEYNYGFDGQIADFRFSNTARTAGTPTERLTSDSNTKLLVCTKPYLVDESGTATSLSLAKSTNRSYPSTKPFAPYNNLEYSAADHRGSIYFDGTDDALEISDNADFDLSGGSWTIECWWYPLVVNTYDSIFNQWNGATAASGRNINVSWESNRLYLFGYDGGTFISSIYHDVTAAQLQNRWNHVAAVFDGTKTELYLNGEASGRAYVSSNNLSKDVASEPFRVAKHHRLTSYYYNNSYVSDLRLVKGTAVYSGAFTPPTGPLTTTGGTYPSTTNVNTSITAGHTKLFLKGTDASIIDKSQVSNLKLVGNTTGSTTQVKFANTKSIYFDGAGDYIKTPASTDYDFPADFTIEAWIYPTALTSNRLIVDTYNASQAGSYQLYWRSTGGGLAFYTQADGVVIQDPSGSNIQVNTWHHVAVTRSGSTFRMFVDGTQVNSTTFTRDLTHGIPVAIGYQQATGTNYFVGYMQDVRITKGLARYTANFTPPTESLKG